MKNDNKNIQEFQNPKLSFLFDEKLLESIFMRIMRGATSNVGVSLSGEECTALLDVLMTTGGIYRYLRLKKYAAQQEKELP